MFSSNIIGIRINHLPNGYQPILDYYNSNKPEEYCKIEKIKEQHGFMIKLKNYNELNHVNDENSKIQKLIWNKNKLIPGFLPFNEEQISLLYEALVVSLGENNVYKF